MSELLNATKLVKAILEENEKARNSDDALFKIVVDEILSKQGIDSEKVSFIYVMDNRKKLGIPAFETIRRSRQKVQQHHPELCGCDKVEGHRTILEEVYKDYARGVV